IRDTHRQRKASASEQHQNSIRIMKTCFTAVVLAVLYCAVESNVSPAQVQVYSKDPATMGKSNTLICLVKNFHPPEIQIELLSGQQVIAKANQTDLSFDKTWHFHLSRHAEIIPEPGHKYACRVTHSGSVRIYAWDPNM
ncbi:hypothetical protein NHX12_008944, partial [Muraenolepis orangiensis]